MDETLKIAVELQLDKLRKQQKELDKILSSKKGIKNVGGMASQQVIKVNSEMKKLEKTMKGTFLNPDVFQGWAMSLMFAGMAMQRMASSIYKFGTKAFQEISHSVEGTVTQTDMLEGSMKYLGFTIGEALEPVVSFLIPIVDKLSEIIEKNPGIARLGIIILTVAGAILTFSGMMVLAVTNGLLPLIAGLTTLNAKILVTTGIFKGLTVGALFSFLAIVAGIALVLGWIFKMKDAMGGWGEFFKSVVRGALRLVALLAESFAWFGNLLMEVLIAPLNLFIKLINKITQSDFVKDTLGISVKKIGTIETDYKWGDAVLGKYLDWEQNGALAPDKGYSDSSKLVPTYNINIEKIETTDMDSLMSQLKQYTV